MEPQLTVSRLFVLIMNCAKRIFQKFVCTKSKRVDAWAVYCMAVHRKMLTLVNLRNIRSEVGKIISKTVKYKDWLLHISSLDIHYNMTMYIYNTVHMYKFKI